MIDAPGCTGELSNILGNKCVPSMTEYTGIIWNIHTEMGQNRLRQPILPQEQNHGNYGITAKHYIDVYLITVLNL